MLIHLFEKIPLRRVPRFVSIEILKPIQSTMKILPSQHLGQLLLFSFFIFSGACVCTCAHRCMRICVYMCVEARSQHQESSSIIEHFFFFWKPLSVNLELIGWASLAGQRTPGIFPLHLLSPELYTFTVTLGYSMGTRDSNPGPHA